MATTKLWHIKGSIKDLIEYVENPEKTTKKDKSAQDFYNVFAYARNPDKTNGEQYVTAINCQKDIALRQMILTKQQYGKDDGYIAWHGYQSFKPGEVTPDQCHEIGVAFAKEMWGDRFQIVVTTHLDKEHLHNHFAFNSVSFIDGSKYNFSKAEQKRMREVSDRLCIEHGLSVIEHPHKAPSRPVWLDEKSGKPTRYNIYRDDIYDAFMWSHDILSMEIYLNRLGYITDFTGEHFKIRLPQYQHFTRLDTLNKNWTPDNIMEEMYNPRIYMRHRDYIADSLDIPEELCDRSILSPERTQLQKLYLFHCYALGILPKGTTYKPTSPFLREELRKLDEIDRQTRYLGKYNINTLEELNADRNKNKAELGELTKQKIKLENKIRRASPEDKKVLQIEKAEISEKIRDLRLRIRCADGVEKRSARLQNNLALLYSNEERNEQRQKAKTKHKGDYER